MWDEQDHTARWVQGLCAVFLAAFAAVDAYIVFFHFGYFYGIAGITLFLGAVRLCWRCAWYAATGKNNVNRDGY